MTADHLDAVVTGLIAEIERLESMITLQRGVIDRIDPQDPKRLKRETERFAAGIRATSANLRRALSELRAIQDEAPAE